jgi:hypothetical protein
MRNEESDVAGLFPRMDLSRRGFVMTSLATDFLNALLVAASSKGFRIWRPDFFA